MGFPEDKAQATLIATNGNVDEALSILLEPNNNTLQTPPSSAPKPASSGFLPNIWGSARK